LFRNKNIEGCRKYQKETALINQCPNCKRKSAIKHTFPVLEDRFGQQVNLTLYSQRECKWCDFKIIKPLKTVEV